MNLVEIRHLFFLFIKQFTRNEIDLLMNFLSLVINDYQTNREHFIS